LFYMTLHIIGHLLAGFNLAWNSSKMIFKASNVTATDLFPTMKAHYGIFAQSQTKQACNIPLNNFTALQ
jgi:hypothetical protein